MENIEFIWTLITHLIVHCTRKIELFYSDGLEYDIAFNLNCSGHCTLLLPFTLGSSKTVEKLNGSIKDINLISYLLQSNRFLPKQNLIEISVV